MNYKNILITGGAGFVGSNLAISIKRRYPKTDICCLDNLSRNGSELNLPRLKEAGIRFVRGDIRNPEDLSGFEAIDALIECSAECSVLAGYNDPVKDLIDTNFNGTVNCLELARRTGAFFTFLSTSRVYSIEGLRSIQLKERNTRYDISSSQMIQGITERGISEKFPVDGHRSFYGSSKLCSELFIREYGEAFGLNFVINRCGVISGPWQMGKVDQGVVALWVARHYFKKGLSYIGHGGKQVRDVIHIDDLCDIIDRQLSQTDLFGGRTLNVGGGADVSTSLLELTQTCRKITGISPEIGFVQEERTADIPVYISDISEINRLCGWKPVRLMEDIVKDIFNWIQSNEKVLRDLF